MRLSENDDITFEDLDQVLVEMGDVGHEIFIELVV